MATLKNKHQKKKLNELTFKLKRIDKKLNSHHKRILLEKVDEAEHKKIMQTIDSLVKLADTYKSDVLKTALNTAKDNANAALGGKGWLQAKFTNKILDSTTDILALESGLINGLKKLPDLLKLIFKKEPSKEQKEMTLADAIRAVAEEGMGAKAESVIPRGSRLKERYYLRKRLQEAELFPDIKKKTSTSDQTAATLADTSGKKPTDMSAEVKTTVEAKEKELIKAMKSAFKPAGLFKRNLPYLDIETFVTDLYNNHTYNELTRMAADTAKITVADLEPDDIPSLMKPLKGKLKLSPDLEEFAGEWDVATSKDKAQMFIDKIYKNLTQWQGEDVAKYVKILQKAQ